MSEKLGWSYIQSIDDMNIGRYFEYDIDAFSMFEKKLSFLAKGKPKVLEIGSGSGFFTNILLSLFPEIQLTCLEPDEIFIKELEQRFGDKIETLNELVEKNSLAENTFDFSISHIVLHNLFDPIQVLKEMMRLTKNSGKIVCIEPLPCE